MCVLCVHACVCASVCVNNLNNNENPCTYMRPLSSLQTRVLKNDFAKSNVDDEDLMDEEENGWKIIHTDVFRFPPYKAFFCAILGKYGLEDHTH